MTKDVAVVFTDKSLDELKEVRGSQAWAIKLESVNRCRYLVCTRNRKSGKGHAEDHKSAFLVAKIESVEPAPMDEKRFIIKFIEYALVDVKSVWPGHRFPVWYIDSLNDIGIDENRLSWKALTTGNDDVERRGLNDIEPSEPTSIIFQAKELIARSLGIRTSQIEITIKA